MTAHPMGIALAFAAGIGIGGFYFTGLWWTVQRLPRVRHPGAWMTASFLVRAGLCLPAFYGLLQVGWPLLPSTLAGFILVRMVATHRLKPAAAAAAESESRRMQETHVRS